MSPLGGSSVRASATRGFLAFSLSSTSANLINRRGVDVAVLGRRRRIHWSVKLGVTVASILATAYITASARGVLPSYKSAVVTAIVVIAVVSIGTSARSTIWGRRAQKTEDVREALVSALFSVQDLTSTDARDVNAVFLVKRLSWRLRSYLDPTVRAELGVHEPSRVQWVKGKGIIGTCWTSEQAQFGDLRELHSELGSCTEEQWNARAPTADRIRLSFQDWERTRSKYGFVVAAPTRRNNRITGAVALNGPLSADWVEHDEELRSLAIFTAQTVADVLG